MKLNNIGCWFLVSLLIVSCSDIKSTRYQDNSELEMPPRMKIVEKPKAIVEKKQEKVESGLSNDIFLAGSPEKPIIKIKKLFDRSWNIVEQALKLREIEISDKNRELGVFYVLFDPDAQTSGTSGLFDNLTFFFFEDEYEEAAYKIHVVWRDSDTEVSVELVDQENNDLLDDGEDDFDGAVDGGAQLIKVLFKTIRDDLPVH